MPNVGELSYSYGRQYRYIKPNATDPGTFRLASPEEGVPGGGGGGGTTPQDIEGVLPIVATTVNLPTVKTTVSMNIQALPSRV